MNRILILWMAPSLIAWFAAPALARETNEGAQLVAPFAGIPPVIDGVVSEGEWDNAGTAGGAWSPHNDPAPVDPAFVPVVKVQYGLRGLYILFEHPKPDPAAGDAFERLGEWVNGSGFVWQNYCSVYIDPTGGETGESFGFHAEPSVSVHGPDAVDPMGNSYTETGVGRGGLATRWTSVEAAMAAQGVTADEVWFWDSRRLAWDFTDSRVLDGLKPDGSGFVVEWMISYTDLSHGFWNGWAVVAGDLADVNLDEDRFLKNDAGNGPLAVGLSAPEFAKSYVNGMPAPGTVWEMNFGANWAIDNDESTPAFYNWVGDTAGFDTKPFGRVIFGEAEPAAVREAILHDLNQNR